MSNYNAVNMGDGDNQLARIITSVQPENKLFGSAAILPVCKLLKYTCQFFIDARKLLLALKAWICANSKEFTIICVGIILFVLACATPAILGAIGFSAMGPVLGSIAAGWQASIGSVAAGTLFAFLQSVAMGEAVFGLVTGIRVLGVLVALIGVGRIEFVRNKVADISENVGENFVKAGEVIRDGAYGLG